MNMIDMIIVAVVLFVATLTTDAYGQEGHDTFSQTWEMTNE